MGEFRHHSYFPKEREKQGYLFPHVCFQCRKSFKKPAAEQPRLCPQCAGETVMLSRKFSAPKASDLEQWKKVEFLVAHGFVFQSIREPNGLSVSYPSTLADAKAFVAKYATCITQGRDSAQKRSLESAIQIM